MTNKWKDIGTLLLEYGLITDNDLKEGVKLQKETGLRLGEALAKLGKISMEDIDWVLSKQLDIPFVIVEDITPNYDLLSRFRKEFLIETRYSLSMKQTTGYQLWQRTRLINPLSPLSRNLSVKR